MISDPLPAPRPHVTMIRLILVLVCISIFPPAKLSFELVLVLTRKRAGTAHERKRSIDRWSEQPEIATRACVGETDGPWTKVASSAHAASSFLGAGHGKEEKGDFTAQFRDECKMARAYAQAFPASLATRAY